MVIKMENKLEISLPEAFREIDDKQKKSRFPYEMIPEIIFIYKNMTFSGGLLNKYLEEKEVLAAGKEIERQISHVYPESRLRPCTYLRKQDTVIGGFSFKTDSLQGEIRHDMFLCPVDNQLFFGGFHYPRQEETEWKDILEDIIKSIKTVKGRKSRKKTETG